MAVIDHKVVIITGASQGIGAGLTRAFRDRGHVVVGGVLYLDSAPFVTGEASHIDGGQSAGH